METWIGQSWWSYETLNHLIPRDSSDFSMYLTLFFCVVIVSYSLRYRDNGETPNVATTLGILGTFIGIVYGLFWFDTGAIKQSIPQLLDGLKFAFITSITGIICSVVLKYRTTLDGERTENRGATVETLAQLLRKGNERREQSLPEIERALNDPEASPLLKELRQLRNLIHEKHDRLREEFQRFKDEVARQNADALIEALEQVMRDFNAKLNEHLGDNFKRLNEAIGRLLEWQKTYKDQVDAMSQRLNQAFERVDDQARVLETMKESLEEITRKSKSMVEVSENLNELLRTIQDQQGEMERHLEEFADLADSARQAFPRIEENLEDLTSGFSSSVQQAVEQTEQALEEQRSSFQRLMENFEQLDKRAEEHIEEILRETREMNKTFAEEHQEMIRENIDQIDKALEHELTQSLHSLGSQLASLSQKFASDYQPLTEKLREVVRLADDLNDHREN